MCCHSIIRIYFSNHYVLPSPAGHDPDQTAVPLRALHPRDPHTDTAPSSPGISPDLAHTPDQWATVQVKILAVNDFHGQFPPAQTLNKRPVAGLPVLASYLKSAMTSGNADGTIIALPGDVIGYPPPESGLLFDEPPMLFFNSSFSTPLRTQPTPPLSAAASGTMQCWATRSLIKGGQN